MPPRDRLEVIVMQGPPGSGKSTWARQYVAEHQGAVGIVSRDTIREHVLGVRFDPEVEPMVTGLQASLAHALVNRGLSVLVDDTNMKPHYVERWRDFAQKRGIATVKVVSMETPIEECIRRDAARERPVGEDVIRRMAAERDAS